MVSEKDILYINIVAPDEVYKFIVLSFVVWDREDAQENNIKFEQHINCVHILYVK
jgi:hypothetical protein